MSTTGAPDRPDLVERARLAPSVWGALTVGLICFVVAFLLSRLELLAVATPLVISAVGAVLFAPRESRAHVIVADTHDEGDQTTTVVARVENAEHAQAVQLRIEPRTGSVSNVFITPRAAGTLRFTALAGHSGPQILLTFQGRSIGADASWVAEPGPPVHAQRLFYPMVRPLRSLPTPHHLLGLTGLHLSERPGSGGEFHDIDAYRPGDRIRRIDWRATAKHSPERGELYVRRTTATSDTAIQLVIDASVEVTGVVDEWASHVLSAGVSSLDLAREAAASFAVGYAALGDRVGFDDFSDASRTIPARSGARHRDRVIRAIAQTQVRASIAERVRAPRFAPGAIVFIFSTFLDAYVVGFIQRWVASGHPVVAVDTLPDRDARGLDQKDRLALRVVELERNLRLDGLRSAGVDIVSWSRVQGGEPPVWSSRNNAGGVAGQR